MKKSIKVLAVLMVAALFVGSVSTYAVGAAGDRGAGSKHANYSSAGFKRFGKMRKPASLEKTKQTEEEKAARAETMKENRKKALDERLAAGKITQEKYDEAIAKLESGEFRFGEKGFKGGRGERPNKAATELTEEEKTVRAETMKENWKKALDERLAAGKITQEKYDEAIAKLESGEFKFPGRGYKGGRWERTNKTVSELT